MSILTKYLDKLGVTTKDLSPEEKKDFDRWHAILSEGEITTDKILQFCKTQKGYIEAQMANMDNSTQKNERLVILNTVYTKFINLIEAPEVEREALEKYLNGLILDIPK